MSNEEMMFESSEGVQVLYRMPKWGQIRRMNQAAKQEDEERFNELLIDLITGINMPEEDLPEDGKMELTGIEEILDEFSAADIKAFVEAVLGN